MDVVRGVQLRESHEKTTVNYGSPRLTHTNPCPPMTAPTEPEVHHTHARIKTRRTKPRITWINAGPFQALLYSKNL